MHTPNRKVRGVLARCVAKHWRAGLSGGDALARLTYDEYLQFVQEAEEVEAWLLQLQHGDGGHGLPPPVCIFAAFHDMKRRRAAAMRGAAQSAAAAAVADALADGHRAVDAGLREGLDVDAFLVET
jgi:hypothetical protein